MAASFRMNYFVNPVKTIHGHQLNKFNLLFLTEYRSGPQKGPWWRPSSTTRPSQKTKYWRRHPPMGIAARERLPLSEIQ